MNRRDMFDYGSVFVALFILCIVFALAFMGVI